MNLTDLKWPDIAPLSRDVPVVIPIAALEQHGRHMPLFTDSILLGEVVRRASAALAERVLFAPLMWLGNSEHHLDFPGSMSAAPRTYLDLLRDMAENFLAHGFRRIVFLNGHGGNHVPGSQAVYELRQKHRKRNDLLVLLATYWDVGKQADTMPDLKQRRMGHACEWETSMMLRIADVDIKAKLKDMAALNDPDLRFQMLWSDPSTADYIPDDLQAQNARFPFGKLQFEGFMQKLGCSMLVRGHEKVDAGIRTMYSDATSLITLFSAGGADNNDLPEDSSYRTVTPMAATIRLENGTAQVTPWLIDYARFNDPKHNRFFATPPEIEHKVG